MKINWIRLINFRAYQDTTVHLNRVNIFTGPNGAGKTTLLDAIEFLFTGRCDRRTDDRGVGADDLIRYGTKQATVEAGIEGLEGIPGEVKVARSIPGGLSVEGWQGTSTLQQQALYEKLGAGPATIRAVLHTDRFVRMSANDQKNMLFALAGMEFDQRAIGEALFKWKTDWTTKAVEVFKQNFPQSLAGGAEVFDKLDEIFRDARKAAKKTLKELQTMAEKTVPPQLPPNIAASMAEEHKENAETLLREMRQDRDKLLGQIATANSQAAAAQNAKKRIDQMKTDLAKAKEDLAKQKSDPERQKELEDLVKQLESELADLQTKVAEDNANVQALTGEATGLFKSLQSLESFTGACQVSDAVTCPLGEADIKKLAAKVKKEHEKKSKEAEKLREQMRQRAEEHINPRKEALRKAKEELESIKASVQKTNGLVLEIAKLEELIKVEQRAVDGYKATNTTAMLEQKTKLDEQISKLEEVIKVLSAYTGVMETKQNLENRVEAKKIEVDALEDLVAAFGPKGIKQMLLRDNILPWQQRADELLGKLSDGAFDIVFDVSESFEIKVVRDMDTGNGSRIPATTKLKDLSDGEEMRVGVALQVVLSSITGLGILVVDKAEHLDPDGKFNLWQTSMALEEYGNILILAAKGDVQPIDPGEEGLTVWEVESGIVRPAPSPEALEEDTAIVA